jgi:perosamine synthetase
MNSFAVVRQFEQRVADFAGAKYGIAMNSCTSALFLSLKYARQDNLSQAVILPAKTFISVPMAAVQVGLKVMFEDFAWDGVYRLYPFAVTDSALRFRKGMYQEGLHCLSFHARKLLNIGEGGMVLTDNKEAADWLRKACYSGRGGPDYRVEDIDMIGYQMYMTPEKAARGLHLMDYVVDWEDQKVDYPDLRKVKVFHDQ